MCTTPNSYSLRLSGLFPKQLPSRTERNQLTFACATGPISITAVCSSIMVFAYLVCYHLCISGLFPMQLPLRTERNQFTFACATGLISITAVPICSSIMVFASLVYYPSTIWYLPSFFSLNGCPFWSLPSFHSLQDC